MTKTEVRALQSAEPSTDQPCPLYVEWDDPHGSASGWTTRKKALKLNPAGMATVGFVIRWDPHLVIGASVCLDDDSTVGDLTAIPWSLVSSAQWLR